MPLRWGFEDILFRSQYSPALPYEDGTKEQFCQLINIPNEAVATPAAVRKLHHDWHGNGKLYTSRPGSVASSRLRSRSTHPGGKVDEQYIMLIVIRKVSLTREEIVFRYLWHGPAGMDISKPEPSLCRGDVVYVFHEHHDKGMFHNCTCLNGAMTWTV
jgi:hypothetical protein